MYIIFVYNNQKLVVAISLWLPPAGWRSNYIVGIGISFRTAASESLYKKPLLSGLFRFLRFFFPHFYEEIIFNPLCLSQGMNDTYLLVRRCYFYCKVTYMFRIEFQTTLKNLPIIPS